MITISGHTACGHIYSDSFKELLIAKLDQGIATTQQSLLSRILEIIAFHCENTLGKRLLRVQIGKIDQFTNKFDYIGLLDLAENQQFSKQVPQNNECVTDINQCEIATHLVKSFVSNSCKPFVSFNRLCGFKTIQFQYVHNDDNLSWFQTNSETNWCSEAKTIQKKKAREQFLKEFLRAEVFQETIKKIRPASKKRPKRTKDQVHTSTLKKTIKKLSIEKENIHDELIKVTDKYKNLENDYEDLQLELICVKEDLRTITDALL
jgi:hypothetical protein